MSDTADRQPVYVLGRSGEETRRLQAQAAFVEPWTERLFRDAGIGPGMSVLDLGSGAGDVALLAARLVGPQGSVLGVDMNAVILETARARVHAAGHDNVSFHAGDMGGLALERQFDAVVGRYVLMFVPDPLANLRAAVDHLRPGGVVAIQECDWTQSPYAVPASPLLDRVWTWISDAFRKSGADTDLGPKLRALFLAAGLAEPQLHGDRFVGGADDWYGYDHIAGLMSSVLPFLESSGALTAKEVQIDTLHERLRREIAANGGVVVYQTLVRAWARKP
ncbi:MAG TPA: methyltransferase domain-containing protein [Burkholderiales bacterium]|nr:methyltransferase domain-containing protein [Burkholderiales bacterium]